jgi:hypothetical protein
MTDFNQFRRSFILAPLLLHHVISFSTRCVHKTPEEFKNQDSLLAEQVVKLNFKVKEINDNINSHSPKFSIDLQIRTKYKKGNHRTGTVKAQYNLSVEPVLTEERQQSLIPTI